MSHYSYSYTTSRTVDGAPECLNEINESSDWQESNRVVSSYDDCAEQTPVCDPDHTEIISEAPRMAVTATSLHQTSTAETSSTSDAVVYTKSVGETERYLDAHGIALCKGPDVIRRTVYGEAKEYEQRICLRYLQPPPLPKPGPLTIEEVRKQTVTTSTLVIREQEAAVEAPPPLILRERPPTPPVIPGPEKKTVVLAGETIHHQSVVIERHAAVQPRPRDIIIERWLPYGPVPERERIVKRIEMESGCPKPTCTIVNHEYPQAHVTRKYVVVDVDNADPNDYMVRYGKTLFNSSELLVEARRAGIVEDISTPSSASFALRAERKNIDYRQSRDSFCDCFSSGLTTGGLDVKIGERSGYSYSSRSVEASSTMRSEY